MSATPPASCLISNWSGPLRDSSRRMRSRIWRTSARRLSRAHAGAAPRCAPPRSARASPASPATARACSSAWCSQVHASRCWYSVNAAMLVTSRPPLPLGRSRTSTSYSRPAAECMVSRCTMRCAKRRKNTWLSMLLRCRAPAVSCRSPCGVVQEHQIQVGAVAELPAAELAVADDADRNRAALRAVAAHRHAPLRADLAQRQVDDPLDDELGDIREPIADPHQRQAPGEIRHRHAEHRRLLEVPQRLDLAFGILFLQRIHFQIQFLHQLVRVRAPPRTDAHRSVHRAAADSPRSGAPGSRRSRRSQPAAPAHPPAHSTRRSTPSACRWLR